MTETRRRGRPTKEEAQIRELDEKIAELQAEQAADTSGRALSWDEVTSSTADELARREGRRGILPRLLTAARVKRQELEIRRREREADELREGLEPLYEAFQEKEDELRRAKEMRDKAHGEWAIRLSAVNSAADRMKRAEDELREMQEPGRRLDALRGAVR
jgi:chromosome segregation ATPase